MFIKIACGIGALACLTASVLCAHWSGGVRPRRSTGTLVAIDRQKNLGSLQQGATAEANFTLRNDSSSLVRIESVDSGCSCADADISKNEIGPGETIPLRVRIRVGGRRETLSSLITVRYSSDLNKPKMLYLEAKADVIPDVAIEPSRLVFAPTDRQREVLLAPHATTDVQIESATTTQPAFHAALSENRRKIVVTFDRAGAPVRVPNAELLVATTSKNEPILRIPIEVQE